jgi:hypothetical protein
MHDCKKLSNPTQHYINPSIFPENPLLDHRIPAGKPAFQQDDESDDCRLYYQCRSGLAQQCDCVPAILPSAVKDPRSFPGRCDPFLHFQVQYFSERSQFYLQVEKLHQQYGNFCHSLHLSIASPLTNSMNRTCHPDITRRDSPQRSR